MAIPKIEVTETPAANGGAVILLSSNKGSGPRRRELVHTERIPQIAGSSNGGILTSNAVKAANETELNHEISGEQTADICQQTPRMKGLPNSDSTPRRKKVGLKPEKSGLKRCISVIVKLSLSILAIAGLARLVLYGNYGAEVVPLRFLEYDRKLAEVEGSLKAATKIMQIRVEAMDQTIENEIGSLRKELNSRVEEHELRVRSKVKELDDQAQFFEGKLKKMDFLSKEDVSLLFNELTNSKSSGIDRDESSWDRIRAVARDIVMKEIDNHAADGLGKVDYALASGGGIVTRHSESYSASKFSSWFPSKGSHGVNPSAQKMLQPSFGQPGQCFALKGTSGYVEIKLRTAIIPEAVTLEHVAKSVAYDRTSAPKEFQISGWVHMPGRETAPEAKKRVNLGTFVYDLEKGFVQTFPLDSCTARSCVIDMVRVDFMSNHGNSMLTCFYRLRFHGSEPDFMGPISDHS